MPYLPTGAVLLPDTETLLVCDGYGSSFVHGYSTVDGSYIKGSSFGKIGDGLSNTPGSRDVSWDTNHGIGWNPSTNLLLHCDRVGHRLVYTEADGTYVSHVPLSGGMSLPCSVDFWNGESLRESNPTPGSQPAPLPPHPDPHKSAFVRRVLRHLQPGRRERPVRQQPSRRHWHLRRRQR